MKSPQDRNLDDLLAARLLGLQRGARGWTLGPDEPEIDFTPTIDRTDAMRVTSRMEELGFRFEDRRVEGAPPRGAVLVSFFRDDEVYSALAASETEAICRAAGRFLARSQGAQRAGKDQVAVWRPARKPVATGSTEF